MKAQARAYIKKESQRLEQEDIKKEFQRIENASGSKYSQNYQDDPESTHELKGKRGRPAKSNLHTTETPWQNKQLKTVVNEYNKRTGSYVIMGKCKKHKNI